MKLLIFSLVLAFTAHSAMGFRHRLSSSRARVNMKDTLYATGGTVQCDLCEIVVGDIQSALKGHESQIENLLDSLCSELPQQFQDNCTAILNQYLPILFALIDDMTPAEVCQLLTLCQEEGEELPLPAVTGRESMMRVFNRYIVQLSRSTALKERRVNYIRSLIGDEYLCHACEDTFHFIDDFISNAAVWEEIGELLLPFCHWCPEKYRSNCTDFFNNLPELVSELVDEYLNPEQDCEALGFCCPGEATTPELATEAPEEEELEIDAVEMIPVEPSAQRINVDMNNRIYDMSRLSKNRKMKKLDKTGKNMNRMGIRGMDRMMRKPRTIMVHFEGNTAENQIPYDVYNAQGVRYETKPDETKCEFCRYYSSEAEGILKENEEGITDGLTTVFADICEAIPDPFKDECTREVTDVLPGVIYQLLLKVFSPDFLCTQIIGVCQ